VGETKTCTVTNNDIAPTLTVIKHVINNNGGTATAANFTLDSGGTNDSPDDFAGAESPGTTVTLDAGSYGVTETGPSGYTRSNAGDCSGSIAVGQTKTCTVTNDDQPAHLIVIKHVINDNGGTATAASFSLDSGGTNDAPDNFAGAESPGTTVTLDAGTYGVTETGASGYARSDSADCSGSIGVGQTKTCTVTNNDIAPTLTVIKHVANGPATASQFTLDSGGVNDTPDDFAGSEAGTTVTLNAGSYHVTEQAVAGYTASYGATCTGTITVGQTKTCTVTNTLSGDTSAHHIYATGTTCQNFRDTPTQFELTQIQYTAKAKAISQVNPGVFFYYASVTAPASGTWIITNGQANDSTTPLWKAVGTNNDQIILYTRSGCVRVQAVATTYSNGTVTITVNQGNYTPGATYIYSVKYDPNTLLGQAVLTNQTVKYSFWTINQGVLDFGSFDGVTFLLKK
jgi:hypothetical protein